jgi:hypothetical protein
MATFRQEQIEEILNYDRSMNRLVLDNQISQVTRFNDERNPPTNRDIKFEALLGTLIDGLKAKMAEALTSIAAQQYPKTDATTATTLLGLPTGEKKADFRSMNYADIKRAQKLKEDYLYNQQQVKEAEQRGETLEKEEEGEDEEESGTLGTTHEDKTPNAGVKTAATAANAPGDEDWGEWWVGSGGPGINKVRKFHLKGMERNVGYGGNGEEAGTQTTANDLAGEKSHATHTNATENILYEIVTQYNGIIDKLLQATQPDGRFATKRSVTSSNTAYFADVLKGLLEPLRHLVFEITQIRNPNLASVLNMMTSMVDMIDVSPPFQKINVTAYKSGMPDFQGLTSETQFIDADGYIADLKRYRERIREMLNQVKHQIKSVLFNAQDPKLKTAINKQLKEKEQQYQKVYDSIGEEMRQIEARQLITSDFKANASIIKSAEELYEELENFLLEGPEAHQQFVETFTSPPEGPVRKLPDETYREYHERLGQAIRSIDDELDKIRVFREETGDQPDPELDDKYNDLGKLKRRIMTDLQGIEEYLEASHMKGEGMPEGNVDIGGSGGLADLLASRKPQYWHHRVTDLYDFDKQHNELIKSNENWQAKSNPVHTTPIGKLYPFYKKDKASKYSFPLKLKNELAVTRPDDTQKDARGADVSLLQGPIGAPLKKEKLPPPRNATTTHRTKAEADMNILKGNGKKNSKALHKLTFDDEDNEMFEDERPMHPKDGGMVPEEEPESTDRFRNKKLGPVKKKSVRK